MTRAKKHKPAQGAGLQFVTITDPAQARDRALMRSVRSHVMTQYAQEKRSIKKPGRNAKPRLLRPTQQPQQPHQQPLPQPQQQGTSSSTSPSSGPGDHVTRDVVITASTTEAVLHGQGNGYRQVSYDSWAGDPVRGREHFADAYEYAVATLANPAPNWDLGSVELDPFSTLPPTSVSAKTLTKLVKHCNAFMAPANMIIYRWIPTAEETRLSFLALICVASSHYDHTQGRTSNGVETLSLKNDFISLVNENVSRYSAVKVDNNTIMAAVRLLKMELAMQNRDVLQKLEAGLRQMIYQSGGLAAYDKIAAVIVGTVYMLAITQELIPAPIYTDFLPWTNAKLVLSSAVTRYSTWNARIDHRRLIVLGTADKPIPKFTLESPMFCPLGSFHALRNAPICSPATLALLSELLTLTNLFLDHRAPAYAPETGAVLERLLDLPSAADPKGPVYRDWVFESVRLISLIYGTALHHHLPFSAAYAVARDPTATTASSSGHSSTSSTSAGTSSTSTDTSLSSSATSTATSTPTPTPSSTASPPHHQSLLTPLLAALYKTDPHEMWGPMAGVLFWLCLVGAAAGRDAAHRQDCMHLGRQDSVHTTHKQDYKQGQARQDRQEDSAHHFHLHDDPTSSTTHRHDSRDPHGRDKRDRQDAMHRRSLVWIAVQCTAVTTMGHSDAEMGILRRLVRVVEVLGSGDGEGRGGEGRGLESRSLGV